MKPQFNPDLTLHPISFKRFEGGKRKRDLEAATPLWRIELEIKNGAPVKHAFHCGFVTIKPFPQEKFIGGQSLRLRPCMPKDLVFISRQKKHEHKNW